MLMRINKLLKMFTFELPFGIEIVGIETQIISI